VLVGRGHGDRDRKPEEKMTASRRKRNFCAASLILQSTKLKEVGAVTEVTETGI